MHVVIMLNFSIWDVYQETDLSLKCLFLSSWIEFVLINQQNDSFMTQLDKNSAIFFPLENSINSFLNPLP